MKCYTCNGEGHFGKIVFSQEPSSATVAVNQMFIGPTVVDVFQITRKPEEDCVQQYQDTTAGRDLAMFVCPSVCPDERSDLGNYES